MLQAGGWRLEEVRGLRAEQEVLERLGLDELPSADALGDWLRRMGRRGKVSESYMFYHCCPIIS